MRNQHDIAYELERCAEKILHYDFDHSGTFFDRDVIHQKNFYSVMYFLLFIKTGFNEKSLNFVNARVDLKDKNIDDIPDYEAVFDEFMALFNGDGTAV